MLSYHVIEHFEVTKWDTLFSPPEIFIKMVMEVRGIDWAGAGRGPQGDGKSHKVAMNMKFIKWFPALSEHYWGLAIVGIIMFIIITIFLVDK